MRHQLATPQVGAVIMEQGVPAELSTSKHRSRPLPTLVEVNEAVALDPVDSSIPAAENTSTSLKDRHPPLAALVVMVSELGQELRGLGDTVLVALLVTPLVMDAVGVCNGLEAVAKRIQFRPKRCFF